jgi:hypothetical protein
LKIDFNFKSRLVVCLIPLRSTNNDAHHDWSGPEVSAAAR